MLQPVQVCACVLLQVYYHGDMKAKYGGFAEYAVTTTATLRHIPPSLSFESTGGTHPPSLMSTHCFLGWG